VKLLPSSLNSLGLVPFRHRDNDTRCGARRGNIGLQDVPS
jgi:hypothetical protein